MKKQITDLAAKASSGSSKAMTVIGDLNGDGKVDKADWEIARRRTKEAAGDLAEEAARLGAGQAALHQPFGQAGQPAAEHLGRLRQ